MHIWGSGQQALVGLSDVPEDLFEAVQRLVDESGVSAMEVYRRLPASRDDAVCL